MKIDAVAMLLLNSVITVISVELAEIKSHRGSEVNEPSWEPSTSDSPLFSTLKNQTPISTNM